VSLAVLLVPVATALACAAVILGLLKRASGLPLDHPNERSLHETPVPRVGGVGIIAGSLLAFLLLRAEPLLAALVAALSVVSYLDDRSHLPIAVRFAAHAAAAVAFVYAVAPDLHPLWQVVTVLAAVWMTNLYNFMDGSDGLAGGMTMFGFGAYAVAAWLGASPVFASAGASIAAAAAAFLAFNFHPARAFMGDVGSIPLGFLAAAMGLLGWRDGLWPLWFPVLVFSPFIVDASITLARRMLRGERFWQAHKSHYYQRLVQLGWGHRKTALVEYALMTGCAVLALAVRTAPAAIQAAALVLAGAVYAALALSVDRVWHTRAGLGR
jgi:UDP-N-acetylmuramyl pentapeptide phosphotransferase/UDP-N-acetylglucosamine-1-phosphate transferase